MEMINPDSLAQSISGYSVDIDRQRMWAPFALNNAPSRPHGAVLSIEEGGRPSQERFQELAALAVQNLNRMGQEITVHNVRLSLVDGSMAVTEGMANPNYKGGVDCSGFVYFVLKQCMANIDDAIAIPPEDVTAAIRRNSWKTPDADTAKELLDRAADKSLSLAAFTRAFHDNYQPHRNISAARFDFSSSTVDVGDVQPGDIVIYRKDEQEQPNHVALVKDVKSNGDFKIVHSGRKAWNEEIGGVSSFTIRRKNIRTFLDTNRGLIDIKRIDGLKTSER